MLCWVRIYNGEQFWDAEIVIWLIIGNFERYTTTYWFAMGWPIDGVNFAAISTNTAIKTMGVRQFKMKKRHNSYTHSHTPKIYSLHWIFMIVLVILVVFFFSWWAAFWCVLFGCRVDDFRNRRVYWDSSNCVAAVTDLCYWFFAHLSIYFVLLLMMYAFFITFFAF